mmetsp:Transcript_11522/g.24304  ORF Transcript_11522/g.24304 Transcript_11522/m.24304 type:complete len:242 (+) Transcript_11522:769-1494(+)
MGSHGDDADVLHAASQKSNEGPMFSFRDKSMDRSDCSFARTRTMANIPSLPTFFKLRSMVFNPPLLLLLPDSFFFPSFDDNDSSIPRHRAHTPPSPMFESPMAMDSSGDEHKTFPSPSRAVWSSMAWPDACSDRRWVFCPFRHLVNRTSSLDPNFLSGNTTSSVSLGSFSSARFRSASQLLADPFLPHADIAIVCCLCCVPESGCCCVVFATVQFQLRYVYRYKDRVDGCRAFGDLRVERL